MYYHVEGFKRKCNKTADCQLYVMQLLQIALEDIDMSVLDHINIISSTSRRKPLAAALRKQLGCSELFSYLRN